MSEQKLIYRTREDRGYVAEAWEADDGDALIRILHGADVVREFRFPAYKVYNIGAHFSEIVDSEIAKNTDGYEHAASTGIG